MREPILVLNAGSSSVKFSLFETDVHGVPLARAHGEVDGIGNAAKLRVVDREGSVLVQRGLPHCDHAEAIATTLEWLAHAIDDASALRVVGHRVVHGGDRYAQPVRVDAEVLAGLEALAPLAPLHQPHQIAALRAIARLAPDVPQVACFDTAFHGTQPAIARQFALPRDLTAKGIRRYGFHGLSYEYVASKLPDVAPQHAGGRVVVAHLGNGASMCAMSGGRSVATTMGFTAVDGLPMGTRSGTLDPGVVLYLMRHEGMTVEEVERLVYERSGLLGVSGLSSDMRTLLASEAPAAKEAIDLFVYRIGRELGSLVAALGGLDALVFTGGIGENAAAVRARACADAAWAGVTLDAAANECHGPLISRREARVGVYVVPTDENLMVARHARQVIDAVRPSE